MNWKPIENDLKPPKMRRFAYYKNVKTICSTRDKSVGNWFRPTLYNVSTLLGCYCDLNAVGNILDCELNSCYYHYSKYYEGRRKNDNL